MAEKLKVELQDENGNVYYLHTDASVVFCEDGQTVESKMLQKIDQSSIIQNATTAATDKVVSAAVAKALQDQITEQNTNKLQARSGWLSNLSISASANSTFDITFTSFPHECYIVIPIVRGGVQFQAWINAMTNGTAQIVAISTTGQALTNRNIQWIAIGY